VLSREEAVSLLTHYGVPISPVSKVYKGEKPAGPTQRKLDV
jgi:hypothetical protein